MLESGAPVTALLCLNDRVAFGAYQALEEHGLRVPDDVSIASFDDDEIASYLRPALTTARLPYEEMGRKAMELVLGPDEPGRASTSSRCPSRCADSIGRSALTRAPVWREPSSRPSGVTSRAGGHCRWSRLGSIHGKGRRRARAPEEPARRHGGAAALQRRHVRERLLAAHDGGYAVRPVRARRGRWLPPGVWRSGRWGVARIAWR